MLISQHAVGELLIGAALVCGYGIVVLGSFARIRTMGHGAAASLAIAVPIAQGLLSLAFQVGFLLGVPLVGAALALGLLAACARQGLIRHRHGLGKDLGSLAAFVRRNPWCSIPVALACAYTLAQILLLPPNNHDALTYHLPRVWLFIQHNTFFLEAFNRYHEAVFPVGSDILFYPFLSLGTTAGLGIFSLSSYLAIGAATYGISRLYTTERTSAVCALAILSLTELILQAATIKNDIVMAAVATVCLLIVLKLEEGKNAWQLMLLGFLLCFGISVKTTFIAFLPGFAALLVFRLRLWRFSNLRILLQELAARPAATWVAWTAAILILSQIWLFAWNTVQFGGWTGPDEFTHRHGQHDGAKGIAANLVRYGFQTAQVGYLTDTVVAPTLGADPFSVRINDAYYRFIDPIFGKAGATREEFSVTWYTHEDFAWFGPLGALIVFLFVPYALIRRPRAGLALLPALSYLLILAAKVSWMPWNGRFFSAFFAAAVPAVALTLDSQKSAFLSRFLMVLGISSIAVVKLTDFQRPLVPMHTFVAEGRALDIPYIIRESFANGRNVWAESLGQFECDEAARLLDPIPTGADVALFTTNHYRHFRFFTARPDIHWHPLDRIVGIGSLTFQEAVSVVLRSDIPYLLVLGTAAPGLEPYRIGISSDGFAELFQNPGPQFFSAVPENVGGNAASAAESP